MAAGARGLEIGTFALDGSDDADDCSTHEALDENRKDWSPDGTRIAFVSNRAAYESPDDDLYASHFNIYTMAADGSDVIPRQACFTCDNEGPSGVVAGRPDA